MIEPDDFDALIQEVAALNDLDLDTAGDVVVAVGDTPVIDLKTGQVVASLEDGRTLMVTWPEDDE